MADDVEHLGIKEINPRHCQIRFGILRLFLNPHHPVAHDLSHPEPLRVLDRLEQDPRTMLLGFKSIHIRPKFILKDVISQDHADLVPCGKVLTQSEGLGNTTRFVLHFVSESTAKILS